LRGNTVLIQVIARMTMSMRPPPPRLALRLLVEATRAWRAREIELDGVEERGDAGVVEGRRRRAWSPVILSSLFLRVLPKAVELPARAV
jgi:hypothetical protein